MLSCKIKILRISSDNMFFSEGKISTFVVKKCKKFVSKSGKKCFLQIYCQKIVYACKSHLIRGTSNFGGYNHWPSSGDRDMW